MNIKIQPSPLSGTLPAVASKSMAHRLLICAALADSPSTITCAETSADIEATVRCLTALGSRILYDGGAFHIDPLPRPVAGERALDAGESGSTLRFLLPVACALGAEATFYMSGRLPERPLSPLYEELISHGCAISAPGFTPIRTGGRLKSGNYTIHGGVSSQFISGLLFALPLTEGESVIRITGDVESRPYVDMTVDALRRSGVAIRTDADGRVYRVSGNQRYAPESAATVEGDWSNAAFWLCLGAVGTREITVTNLNLKSLQGDKSIMELLIRFGARVASLENGVTVSRGALRGIEIDAGNTPDLVPALAAVASVAEGRTVIKNAGRLRLKESDRLKTTASTLGALGADISETDDGLVIRGKNRLNGGTADSHGDHRIAMAAAVAASVCRQPVIIQGAEAVQKSYPGFFEDYQALGGILSEDR